MVRRIALPLLLLGALSCQRRGEPIPTLTQEQWSRVQENFVTGLPSGATPINAVFGSNFKLLGWQITPPDPRLGSKVKVSLYWECLETTETPWRIFLHLDGSSRQNLDHDAVGNAFPTARWQKGNILRDDVEAKVDAATGDITLFAGFFKGSERLAVTDPGTGKLEADGRLRIGSFTPVWEPPTLEIKRVTAPLVIDGRVSDRAWNSAAQTPLWRDPVSGDEVSGLDSWAKLLWDDQYLYVAFSGRDTDVWANLTDRDANLWEEEVFELFIDAGRNGTNYLEFQINPANTVFDAVFADARNRKLDEAKARNIEGLESAVYVNGTLNKRDDTDRAWTAEVRIPLAAIPSLGNLPPRDGDTMRVNFYRYDRGAGDDATTLAWSAVGAGTFHNPERFGVATFVGAGTPLMPGMADGSGAPAAEGSGVARPFRPVFPRGIRPTSAASPPAREK